MNTLLIERDSQCTRQVRDELVSLGHRFVWAVTQEDVRDALLKTRFDAMVVAQECFPWITPGLRAYGLAPFAPVLMLGPSRTASDFEQAVEAGVDGWMGKPFTSLELRSWLFCLTQRKLPPAVMEVSFADIVLNLSTYEVWINRTPIRLSRKDFALLRFFVEHPEQLLAADVIWSEIWGSKRALFENLVHVYVSRLRALLAAHSRTTRLATFRSRGYSLQATHQESGAGIHELPELSMVAREALAAPVAG